MDSRNDDVDDWVRSLDKEGLCNPDNFVDRKPALTRVAKSRCAQA